MATAIERAQRATVRQMQRDLVGALVRALRADASGRGNVSRLQDVWQGQILAAFWSWTRRAAPAQPIIEAAIRHLQDVADDRIRRGEDLPTFEEVLRSVRQTPSGDHEERFPRRAQWLRDQMHRRQIRSPYAFERRGGGLSKHTVARILRGDPVRDDSLQKLVNALNHGRRPSTPLTLADVPSE